MANVNVTLSISSPDVLSSALSVGVGVNVLADSGHLTRSRVLATAAGATALTVYKASDKKDTAYVYAKNMSEEKEDFLYVYVADGATATEVLKIGGGEFAWMPVQNNITLKAYGTKINQVLEYATFGLDSSDVTLS